jgi:hypothetical protein
MRALGPGSVSSLLKIVLDVVYGLMLFVVGILVIAAVAALLFKLDGGVKKSIEIARMLHEVLPPAPADDDGEPSSPSVASQDDA